MEASLYVTNKYLHQEQNDTQKVLQFAEGTALRYGDYSWPCWNYTTLLEQATHFANHITGLSKACVVLQNQMDNEKLDKKQLQSRYEYYQGEIKRRQDDIRGLAQKAYDTVLHKGGLLKL